LPSLKLVTTPTSSGTPITIDLNHPNGVVARHKDLARLCPDVTRRPSAIGRFALTGSFLVEQIDNFSAHIAHIKGLDVSDPYADPLWKDAFTYRRDGAIEVMYSPFDYIVKDAKLAIVGITPGRAPALRALDAAHMHLKRGDTCQDSLRAAKMMGSFSSPGTRNNLVRMMDAIGLNTLFGITTTRELFTPNHEKVHFTSALRYPVFINGKNYNGTPNMLGVPILRELIETYLVEEARKLENAVWLPLGPKPAVALRHLVSLGILRSKQILEGMPHPSGANSERVSAFLETKHGDQLSRVTNASHILAAKAGLIHQIQLLRSLK
jgi:hypothetical protein